MCHSRRCWVLLIALLLLPSTVWGDGVEVYRRVAPSTVQILPPGQVNARGSGSLIDVQRRLVLTADHVIASFGKDAGKESVVVMFAQQDAKQKIITDSGYYRQRLDSLGIRGRVVLRDSKRDLALIQLERVPSGVKAVPLASVEPEPGEIVHVIGMSSVQHGGAYSYCSGSIRNVFVWTARQSVRVIAHHAPTNKGDSGGPVLNDRGELVAVVSTGTIGEPSKPGEWTYQQQVVDHSIHVSEVRAILESYSSVASITPAIQKLIDQLRAPDETVRLQAAKMLGKQGTLARGAIPALEQALHDPDPDVRAVAASAIRAIQASKTGEAPNPQRSSSTIDQGRPVESLPTRIITRKEVSFMKSGVAHDARASQSRGFGRNQD